MVAKSASKLVLDASAEVRIIEASPQAALMVQARREVAALLIADQRLLKLAARVLP